MALFKILSNMDDASKTLPSNYNQGYCYFDVNTKKFWIDTAPNSATATEKAAGRVPLNALRADFADMGVRIPFATCSSAASAVNKIAEFGSEEVPWVGNTPPAGTMLAVYFLNANTAENPTIQLDKGFQSKQVNIHCTYLKPAGPGVSDSWDAGSVVIFTYIPATKSASHTDEWVMASYQDPTSFMETYTGPNSIEYVEGTQTSATNAWTGRTKSASLYTGKVIIYKLPRAGTSSAATLNLTLSTGATTGAKAIKLGTNGTSNVTTHYGAGAHLFMIYNGTNWVISSQYDSNNYDRLQLNRAVKAASAITAGQIIVGTSAGYKPATAGTTFDITYPILYASAAIASGATATTTYLRYTSVNVATTQSNFSGTAYQSLYLKGKLNGTTFTIASITNLISQVENDDDCYIPLGILYNTTNAYFYPSNQIFEYRNNELHLVRDGRAINTITRSGNTFTATRDDGSTFTFTQKDDNTTYTFANGTNGSFKVTPSGGSAQTVSIGKPATAGAADTASKFSSARTVELLGDVTGSESSDGTSGWSINTTIGTGKVTNNMLAGSIANGKLANSKITIAGNDVSLGGSLAVATLRNSLGLSNALHFIGVATNTITDGGTQDPGISGYNTTVNRQAGDVVLSADTHYEYVWTGSKWELLGGDSSYKIVQTAVGDGDATVASDTVVQFVSGVTQNTNGEIAVTKKNIRTATTTASGIVTLNANTTNTLINQLSTGDSVPTDGDYYIAQYVGGGTTTTTYHRRPISRLWQYMFNKLNPSWSAWTAGSSEGPKANLVLGGTTYTTPAIPAAGISASGIVNTLAQTFSGNKLFVDGVGVGVDDTSNDGLKILQVYNGGNAEYGSFTISTLGTDATVGVATLKVGNTTASGANYNAKGQLILYNTNTKGSALESKYTGSNALSTMYLPNYDSGYLTHTAGTAAVGSTTQPVYVAANGRITAITGNIANGTTGNAATASKVNNNLVIKVKTGTTEGTDLYTFNGSAAKTLDIKQGTGITLTAAAGSLTIANSGVRSIATGSTNGTISVNTNGTTADVAVKGLGSNAYTSTAYLPLAGGTMTGTLNIRPASGEGGELHLCASTANTNQAGIILDQLNSTFRIFGIPSADGTTKTGTGTPLVIDPYAKTITGGYTLTGSLSGNASTATKFASNQSVALTGDVTGSASSQAGWSIATTLANSGVTANTYGNTSQQTPSHGGTFNIPYFKVDAKGRVTQAGTTTVKLPADSNTDTKVTQNNVTASNDYRILLSTSATDNVETNTINKNTNLRYNPSTNTLSTGNITGTGNLNITGNANLNGETYITSANAGSLLVSGNANFVQSPTAPTPVATSNDTTIATTAFVMNAFTANDAMVFKGVVNSNSDLPATHYQGWTYKVGTAGTYAGKICEVGDTIYCVTDGTAANNDHWVVVQANIDGYVIGPSASTVNAIARYTGTTGKVIKNSNVTIDDTGNITTPGNINLSTGGANIVWNSDDTWQQRIKTTDDSTADTPVFTFQQSSNGGSAWTDLMTIKDNGKIVATTFAGALDGNAATASLLKPISSTTTAEASTWNIPSGSKQVWGERFKDSTLTYTPSGGSATAITDTGDWTMWLTPNATSNAATLNMRIDGTYYGSFSGNLSGNASTATKATQDESGNNIKASYASSFSISDHTITLKNKNGASLGTVTVPDNDTKNTAGSTDISSKIFLIGATSQAANPQTYSDNQVYVENGTLYLVKTTDLSGTANNKPALILGGADTSTHLEFDANEIQAKADGTSVSGLFINNDGGLVTVGSGGLAVTSLTASQAVSIDANKKLVSTNLTVSDPTASGTGITYIASISQSAVGKITATKSTVRSASTSQTGVVQLSSATNSTSETLAATAKAVKTAYDLANTANTTANNHKYWANIESTSAATYNKAPEVANIKINGNTSASAASTKNVVLQYDSALEVLNFVFS